MDVRTGLDQFLILDVDPNKRITLPEALQHPFFSGVEVD